MAKSGIGLNEQKIIFLTNSFIIWIDSFLFVFLISQIKSFLKKLNIGALINFKK